MSEWNFIDEWQSENLPPNGYLSRRVWLEIKYITAGTKKVTDISEDISRYFISLEYSEAMSDEADDLTLTLEDRQQIWLNDWLPEGEGNMLDVRVHILNRISLNDGESVVKLGKFEIDEIEINGFPSTVKLKAVSVVGEGSLRGERKNQSWEKVTLKKIAEDVASRNKLKLYFDCDENPEIDHVEQADKSDLEFLQKLCKSNGLSLKIQAEQLIIFDEYKYEKKAAMITIFNPRIESKGGKDIWLRWLLDYSFRDKTRDTYSSCEVKTKKGKNKEVIEGKFSPDTKSGSGRTLKISHQVKDEAEAQNLAKKKLREKNKEKTTGRMTTIGNFNLAAGTTVDLQNFGKFDGKYIIDKVSHSISANDFKTNIDLRKCLDGY